MFPQVIKYLFTAVLLLLIASCVSVSTLQLDVLRPAEITIEPEVVSVVVMDNSQPFRSDSVNLIITPRNRMYADTVWIDDFGKIAAQSMAEALKAKLFFDTVYYHNASYKWAEVTDASKASTIRQLCSEYGADAVISLEGYAYKTKLELEEWDYYYGTLDVAGGIIWKIYLKNGEVLDTCYQTDNIFWDELQNSYTSLLKALPSPEEAIETIADYLGEAYLQHITPYWETVSRQYFSGGDHLFSRANDLHKANNWNDAAKIWYNVYQNGNKKQQARAAFNIALSYEVRGNFDEAVAWGSISQQLFEKINASDYDKKAVQLYNAQLAKRFQEKKKLDAQIGPLN